MRNKETKNNKFLEVVLGLCVCILLQGFIFPTLQFSTWDNGNSSISQLLDIDDEDSFIFVSMISSFHSTLLKESQYPSYFSIYLSAIAKVAHGLSPPLV